VIVTGHPSCGKTTRSQRLKERFEAIISSSVDPAHKRLTVTIVNDESQGIARTEYATTKTEKNARAAFSSAVQRELGRERIVIADGMNYIKGFRYQMYCEAKAMGTPSCCVSRAPFSIPRLCQIPARLTVGYTAARCNIARLLEDPQRFSRRERLSHRSPRKSHLPIRRAFSVRSLGLTTLHAPRI